MKPFRLVNLDNRHGAFKDGYTHAIRFERYQFSNSKYDANNVEQKCKDYFGPQSWVRRSDRANWHAEFGAKSRSYGSTPYWIYFRKESDLCFIMLGM